MKPLKKLKKIAFIIFVLGLNNLYAQNNPISIYVSETGNDNNNGSEQTPVKTLTKAQELISNPGNTTYYIYLSGKVYPKNKTSNGDTVNNFIQWIKSGSEEHPIYITSKDECNKATFSRTSKCLDYYLQLINVEHVHISNIIFDKCTYSGIHLSGTKNCSVKNCEFTGLNTCDANWEKGEGGSVIALGSPLESTKLTSDNVISNNIIQDIPLLNTKLHHGIYISYNAIDNIIKNNTVIEPPFSGIHLFHENYNENKVFQNTIQLKVHGKVDDRNRNKGILLSLDTDKVDSNNCIGVSKNNEIINNYVYDSDNTSELEAVEVSLDCLKEPENIIKNNYFSQKLRPMDPYWLNYDAESITDLTIAGDFNGDNISDIAMFQQNSSNAEINTLLGTKERAFLKNENNWWESGENFNISKIKGTVVSGNFNGDDYDDIAAFYYSNNSSISQIIVWLSDGASFTKYKWWDKQDQGGSYNINSVKGRVVCGNFSGDEKDEIATIYAYPNSTSAIHIWKNNNKGIFENPITFWKSNTGSYNANNTTGKVVAGNFASNSYDDIAAFYDYGNNHTRLNIWKTNDDEGAKPLNGSSYDAWTSYNYDSDNITGKVVAGNYNETTYDEIVTLYYYNYSNKPPETRIHIWNTVPDNTNSEKMNPTTSSLKFPLNENLTKVITNYPTERLKGRLLSGNFDTIKGDDISAFYKYGNCNNNMRTHVWSSKNNTFTFINDDLGYPWLTNYKVNFNSIPQILENDRFDDNQKNKSLIFVYPNPTNGKVTFKFKKLPKKLKIFDIEGRLILNREIDKNTLEIQTSHYEKGLYIYNLIFEDITHSGKLIFE